MIFSVQVKQTAAPGLRRAVAYSDENAASQRD